MTDRYEPHCDCLGGHLDMRPDPNGQWCRAEDPHPVADDPSGIVQQMPEGRLRAEGRCSTDSTMRHFAYAVMVPDPDGDYVEYEKARATEADLRAEVERLVRNRDMWRGQCDRQAAKLTEMRAALSAIVACWDGPKYNHFMRPNIDRARAALSPETDGGQDAPADS